MPYSTPLYGRPTVRMKLKPLAFHETCQFWEGLDDEDLLVAYATSGGIPASAALVDPALSMADNLQMMYFGSMAPSYQEPQDLLKQEVRDIRPYNAVLHV